MKEVPVAENTSPPVNATARRVPLRVLHVLHTLLRAGAEQLVYEMATANRDSMVTAAVCLDREGPLADQLRAEGYEVFWTHNSDSLVCAYGEEVFVPGDKVLGVGFNCGGQDHVVIGITA